MDENALKHEVQTYLGRGRTKMDLKVTNKTCMEEKEQENLPIRKHKSFDLKEYLRSTKLSESGQYLYEPHRYK